MYKVILIILLLLVNIFCFGENFRIVSLAPDITEILASLELQNNIVGRTSFCTYPEEVKHAEVVGDFMNFDIEKIVLLKPDIIFITGNEQEKFKNKLKLLNIKVEMIYPKNLNELFEVYYRLGKIFNKEKKAEIIVKNMKKEIEKLKIDKKNRFRCYIELGSQPFVTASNSSFVGNLLENAGFINVFGDKKGDYPVINAEEIVLQNPEVIISANVMADSKKILSRKGWENIIAIKKRNVFDKINHDLILRAGPRSIDGLKALYYEVYKNVKK